MILLSSFRGRMLEDVSLDCGSVIVMLLLFAYRVVMILVSFAGPRGCTSDQGFVQMFIIVPLIAIRYWPDLQVVMTSVFALMVMLADNASGQTSGTMIVMPSLFVITVVMKFRVASVRGCTCDKVFARVHASATNYYGVLGLPPWGSAPEKSK